MAGKLTPSRILQKLNIRNIPAVNDTIKELLTGLRKI